MDHQIALALGGWATGNEAGETATAYGRGYRISTLLQGIGGAQYPDLDLNHLKLNSR